MASKAKAPFDQPQSVGQAVTLSHFIMDNLLKAQKAGEPPQADLAFVINALSVACKVVGNAVQHAGIKPAVGSGDLLGVAHAESQTQTRTHTRLEILANDVLTNALKLSRKAGILVSAMENEPLIMSGEDLHDAKYGVVYDPLDGGSNISCNVSVGTIFGIYKLADPAKPTLADVLSPGRNMICAGYVLYGSAMVMMLTFGTGVYSFTMDPEFGEFVLTKAQLRIPDPPGRVYSINSGNSEMWDQPTKDFVRWTKMQSPQYSARYIGSMVSDVHRTILYGGIFMYPSDAHRHPNGKLRMLYQGFPMAFLCEQAGGKASTGTGNILDLQPEQLHQTCPTFLGCTNDVNQLEYFFANANAQHA